MLGLQILKLTSFPSLDHLHILFLSLGGFFSKHRNAAGGQTPFTLSFCVFSFCSISCSRVVGIDGWLMIHGCNQLHSSVCIFSMQSVHSKLHVVPKFIHFYY